MKRVLTFALAAGLVAGCMGPAERDGGLRAEAARKLPAMPALAERPVKAEAWFMGAGHNLCSGGEFIQQEWISSR